MNTVEDNMRPVGTTALVALLALFVSTGCANKQELPDPGPKPAGADFEGVWYSPQFEHMYLRQSGNEVTGVYTYETGGTLEGTINGNLMKFEWSDPGSNDTATRTMSGKGYFQLVKGEQGPELKGEWGYDANRSGAGPWNAEFVRELESGDPMKLEDLDGSDSP